MAIGTGAIGTVTIGTSPSSGGGPLNYLIFNFTVGAYTPPSYNSVIFNFGGGAPPSTALPAGPRMARSLSHVVYSTEPEWMPRIRRYGIFQAIDEINISILW